MYQFPVDQKYSHNSFVRFLSDFLPDSFIPENDAIYWDSKLLNVDGESCKLGTVDSLNLSVYEFQHSLETDPRVSLTKEIVRYIKENDAASNILAVIYNPSSEQWRLSLITTEVLYKEGKILEKHSNPKRFSFVLGKGCKKHTPETMLFTKGVVKDESDLKSRFAIDVVTESFYKELFSWYEWAVSMVSYPEGEGANVKLSNKNNELNTIRLITRLMFVWFIKQKDLVPDWIFDEKQLPDILYSFNPQSKKEGNYYNAVIQNLFFGTLNKAINERAFAENIPFGRREQYGVNSYYRDDNAKSFFKVPHEKIIEMFRPVPFLNGGLFECLDKLETDPVTGHNVQKYIDGFSRESGRRAFIPNILFFGKEEDGHEGLINLLNRYNFTVQENTPTEIDVALDPELLGKTFENLLGTYNPETSETARKDSGSFYTPREIVNYMVDESLRCYLKEQVSDLSESDLQSLFSDDPISFSEITIQKISNALEAIKVLDPACGSGAFPMGCLQRIVTILEKIGNTSDKYSLKLHLIKNCIYGIDIQPIAVQISKLRFFISLVCEQNKNNNSDDNYGIEPLPNLETKFVAANTLIGRKKNDVYGSSSLFENPEIEETKRDLQRIRDLHFSAKTSSDKKKYREKDKELRDKLARLLVEERYSNPEDAKLLVSWNPYDQNEYSKFFDTEWMFGLKEGFDIVIGNPPYISTKGVSSDDKKAYEDEFGFSDDTYNLFTFKGLQLTRKNGSLTYIIPKTFWTTQTKRNMRDLILSKKINYIFDTANPFSSVMVDTCIIQVQNTEAQTSHKVRFLDGSKNLDKPVQFDAILQSTYVNTQNSVIFKPTDFNLRVYNLYGQKVKELYDKWWDKISTSKDIEKNKAELGEYRNSLKPGDIALLGCLTEGGQGLATANNGKYIAVRKSTKWANNIIDSRPKKLAEAIKKNPKIRNEINGTPQEVIESLSESQIADLFDKLKEKYGRDIFGQGYIYKLVDDSEIANVDELTRDEKENGIDSSKKYYVPYDKGDKDGNRWYLETPFAIAWSKENVRFLKTNSGKKGEGMPVVRNPQFYFKEGFCWSDINTHYLKCRMKTKSINDVKSMSLYGMLNDSCPEYYFIALINSSFMSMYVDNFVNNTQTFQINDARQLPIIIPNALAVSQIKSIFEKAVIIKKEQFKGVNNSFSNENLLSNIQSELDSLTMELYAI